MFKKGLVAGLLALVSVACLAKGNVSAGQVTRATLDNGLRVVIVHSDLAPVVAVNMAYLVGSNEASVEFPGTAHALEHMMFRGSPGLSRDQLLTIAANLGGSYNASTSRGVTQYYFTVPAQDLDVVLHVASIRMRGLDLTEAGWAKERGAIVQEVARDMSSPSYKYHLRLYKHVFAGTPYAHVATGTRASFEKTTAAQLRTFYEKWYVPNNAVLTIAGDVDAEAALATIRRLFGDIPSKPLPARPAFDFRKVQAKSLTEPTDSSLPTVVLAWRMPGANSQDFAAGKILQGVLASRRGQLHALGLTGKAQSSGFGTSVFQHAGMAYVWASYKRDGDAKQQLRQLHQIIQGVVSGGVPEDLFKAAKNKQVSAFEYMNASISGLGSSWVSAVAFRGQDSPDVLRQALAGVTKADVDALARKIFRKDAVVTIKLTPSKTGKARQGPAAKDRQGSRRACARPPIGQGDLAGVGQQGLCHAEVPALDPAPDPLYPQQRHPGGGAA